jgi:uncharacterized membrane protein YcaP (DUF421 family)
MDAVLRALAMYLFLLILFRISGKRSIAQLTTFDFILLLILGEATQQALLGNDFSVTNAFIVILTLMGIDILFSFIKQKFKKFEKLIDGVPLIIVENGLPFKDRMDKSRIDEKDILESARKKHGIGSIAEIRYAILERDGDISIIPKEK